MSKVVKHRWNENMNENRKAKIDPPGTKFSIEQELTLTENPGSFIALSLQLIAEENIPRSFIAPLSMNQGRVMKISQEID